MASKAKPRRDIDGSIARDIFWTVDGTDMRQLCKGATREWRSSEIARLVIYMSLVAPRIQREIARILEEAGCLTHKHEDDEVEVSLEEVPHKTRVEILTLCIGYLEKKLGEARNNVQAMYALRNLQLAILEEKMNQFSEVLGEPTDKIDYQKYDVFGDTQYEVSSASSLSSNGTSSSSTSSGSTTSGTSTSSASSSRSRPASSLEDMNTMFGKFYALSM